MSQNREKHHFRTPLKPVLPTCTIGQTGGLSVGQCSSLFFLSWLCWCSGSSDFFFKFVDSWPIDPSDCAGWCIASFAAKWLMNWMAKWQQCGQGLLAADKMKKWLFEQCIHDEMCYVFAHLTSPHNQWRLLGIRSTVQYAGIGIVNLFE